MNNLQNGRIYKVNKNIPLSDRLIFQRQKTSFVMVSVQMTLAPSCTPSCTPKISEPEFGCVNDIMVLWLRNTSVAEVPFSRNEPKPTRPILYSLDILNTCLDILNLNTKYSLDISKYLR